MDLQLSNIHISIPGWLVTMIVLLIFMQVVLQTLNSYYKLKIVKLKKDFKLLDDE